MPINFFPLMNKIGERANNDIEEMVFESLKQNNFDPTKAINNPSDIKDMNPLYGMSMLNYIYRNRTAILYKLRGVDLNNLNSEEIKKLIHKEILNIELLTHRNHINSEDKETRENSISQVKKIVEELTQLNDSRVDEIKKEFGLK